MQSPTMHWMMSIVLIAFLALAGCANDPSLDSSPEDVDDDSDASRPDASRRDADGLDDTGSDTSSPDSTTGDATSDATSDATITGSSDIQPYSANPSYWQYEGEPIMLIGGSDDDSLFQWSQSALREHLDLLQSVGGNYVRNNMNSRSFDPSTEDYRFDVYAYPFRRLDNGQYDLDQFNEDYFDNLRRLLRMAQDRDIIVQVEFWDIYCNASRGWNQSPYNPDNNVNYTYASTTLTRDFGFINPFFLAVPELNDDATLLRYQEAFVGHVLDVTLDFDNVLYQIDNESPLPFEVSDYWARFIHEQAGDRTVYVTDSRRFHSPSAHYDEFQDWNNPEINHPIQTADLFNFLDLSQNGGNSGQEQYDNLIWYRLQVLAYGIRPINHVKIYRMNWGIYESWTSRHDPGLEEACLKLWRTVFGGAASARYHRWEPPLIYGIGLSPDGQRHIDAMSMLLGEMNIFTMEPNNNVLSSRTDDEAYALVETGTQWAVFFTGHGDGRVSVDLSTASGGDVELRWLSVDDLSWSVPVIVSSGGSSAIERPGTGQWVALIIAS